MDKATTEDGEMMIWLDCMCCKNTSLWHGIIVLKACFVKLADDKLAEEASIFTAPRNQTSGQLDTSWD